MKYFYKALEELKKKKDQSGPWKKTWMGGLLCAIMLDKLSA